MGEAFRLCCQVARETTEVSVEHDSTGFIVILHGGTGAVHRLEPALAEAKQYIGQRLKLANRPGVS